MIEERFLRNAIQIRRTYLKLINNLELYKSSAISIEKKLQQTLQNLSSVEGEYIEKKIDDKTSMDRILKILDEIEGEGRRLESLVNPINEEIEKLAKEEQELYRQITQHHYNLSEEQIIFAVRDRLLKEGLS